MDLAVDEYPLFPLSAVLFPGGSISLRIFEPRYLAMVRDCVRDTRPFAVSLLLRGGEDAETATALAVGTLAQIVDFYTLPDGLLGIRAEGSRRFHVDNAHARNDGLMIGKLSLWPEEMPLQMPPEYSLLSTLAASLIENVVKGGPEPSKQQLDDAAWVSFRLAEILPFTLGERQQLLEITEPTARLQRIVDALPRLRSERGEVDDDDD